MVPIHLHIASNPCELGLPAPPSASRLHDPRPSPLGREPPGLLQQRHLLPRRQPRGREESRGDVQEENGGVWVDEVSGAGAWGATEAM